MQSVIMTILGLLVGIAIAGAGIYYLIKEKTDKDSIKVYGTISLIGTVATIGMVKFFMPFQLIKYSTVQLTGKILV